MDVDGIIDRRTQFGPDAMLKQHAFNAVRDGDDFCGMGINQLYQRRGQNRLNAAVLDQPRLQIRRREIAFLI